MRASDIASEFPPSRLRPFPSLAEASWKVGREDKFLRVCLGQILAGCTVCRPPPSVLQVERNARLLKVSAGEVLSGFRLQNLSNPTCLLKSYLDPVEFTLMFFQSYFLPIVSASSWVPYVWRGGMTGSAQLC